MKSLMYRQARWCATHPGGVLLVAALLSLLAIVAAARLPVHTSRQALLPQDTDVARRLSTFLGKFGAASDLMIAIEGAPRAELESYATELARRLNQQPEIAYATERLDTDFFARHAYLLAPRTALTRLEQGLSLAADAPSVPLYSMLAAAGDTLAAVPSGPGLDLQQMTTTIRAADALLAEWQRWLGASQPPDTVDWSGLLSAVGARELGNGYFASHNGQMLVVFVHPRDASEAFETLQPFNERVRSVAGGLAREYQASGRPAPSFVLTGMPAIEYEEYLDIERDIKLVIWTAAGLIAALILLVVRSIRWALAIFIPMGLGALWSLALALLTVGHLSIITSSFLAILFGLGADYGIFTSSQIAEARRAGKPLIEAIGTGIAGSFSAVMTAGGASLLIFGALATVEFPGFAELGRVAAGGVLLILLGTWLVQPAVYALFPPRLAVPPTPAGPRPRPGRRGAFARSLAWLWVGLALATAWIGIRAGLAIPFDYDVLSLLPADSTAAQYQRRMASETDYQSEVIIFTASNLDDMRRITAGASALPTIARVQSITQLFPEDATERVVSAKTIGRAAQAPGLQRQLDLLDRQGLDEPTFSRLRTVLEKAQTRIEEGQEQAFSAGHETLVHELESLRTRLESLRASLAANPAQARDRSERFLCALVGEARRGREQLAGWDSARALSPGDLPPSLRDRFVAPDGTLAAYAFPAESVYDWDYLERLVREVYAVSPEATGFPTTHEAFSRAVVESFGQGTLLAIAVCLAWLLLILRSLRGFVLASLPLVIGGGWMLGLMALLGLRYNYANIIALPLVIALAVDYGVWFSHRWRALRQAGPLAVTLDAGKVIALAAGTELAGLGAITLASYRGVSGLGMDITLGLLSCLAATLLVAPAIGQLIDPTGKP